MEKMILAVCVTVVVILLSFALGTAFGSSVTHSDFIETLIPLFSMLGGWVSGLGTLGAVLAALWIAEKQRKDDTENLSILFSYVIVAGAPEKFLSVRAVSNGKRPCHVNSIVFSSPLSKVNILVSNLHYMSAQLPSHLGYGASANFMFVEGFENYIAEYINKHCGGSGKGLELVVVSTIKNYKVNISSELMKNFQKLANELKESEF